jgi:hypothetical protein
MIGPMIRRLLPALALIAAALLATRGAGNTQWPY